MRAIPDVVHLSVFDVVRVFTPCIGVKDNTDSAYIGLESVFQKIVPNLFMYDEAGNLNIYVL